MLTNVLSTNLFADVAAVRQRAFGTSPLGTPVLGWNFEKCLINRQGEMVGRFAPDVSSNAELPVSAIERELVNPD